MFKELLVLLDSRLLFVVVSVEHIVLEHEYQIKDNRHNAEHPLHYVEPTPGEGRLPMADGLDHVLQDAEGATDEVEDDVHNGPADCRLALVVKIDLKTQ